MLMHDDKKKESQDIFPLLSYKKLPVKKWGRKILPFTGIAAGILIPAALLYLLSLIFQGTATGINNEDDEKAEILPQMSRVTDAGTDSMNFRDPFAGPGVLVGLITGGQRGDLAIIETSRATYVAYEGDIIDDYWTLKEIGEKEVVLEARGEILIMTLSDERKPGVMQSRNNLTATDNEGNNLTETEVEDNNLLEMDDEE